MAKWNVARGGPEWLMDSEGRVYGYKDKRGREFGIPQVQGSVGDAEGNGPTDTSLKILSGVSADGNPLYADIAYAAVASTTGTPGQVRRLSDGPDRGALLVWSIPEGRSTYAWCWQIYPLAAYL